MLDLVVPAPATVCVPVRGSTSQFPVRRIYCVGRNYLDHVREMGGDAREAPFFFQKPTDAIVLDGSTVPYPSWTSDFQFEVELVLAIRKGGMGLAVADAADHVYGTAVGIDLTRRDVQIEARKTGRPWEIGKSFDHSAPIGDIAELRGLLPTSGRMSLSVNGACKQAADVQQMIWNCAEIVSRLSMLYRLEPGDLIYTGTPAGVGPLTRGDRVIATIEGLPDLTITID